jgi:hypothetical protein
MLKVQSEKYNINVVDNLLARIGNKEYDDVRTNYLYETIKNKKLPSANYFISLNILEEKINIGNKLKEKLKYYNKASRTNDRINKSEEYNKLKTMSVEINESINKLNTYINKEKEDFSTISLSSTIIEKIIKRYEDVDLESLVVVKLWDRLFNEYFYSRNYNLIPIILAIQQKDYKIKEIANDSILYSNLAEISESYFLGSRFTKDNIIKGYIYDMLKYVTKNVICNGIEMVVRRLLWTYFDKQKLETNLTQLETDIDYILTDSDNEYNKSLQYILHTTICEKLIKNSISIFEDRDEEDSYLNESTRDILNSYFELFNGKVPDEVMTIFKTDVISYFDSFVSRTIQLWNITSENILRYFINHSRMIKSLNAICNIN